MRVSKTGKELSKKGKTDVRALSGLLSGHGNRKRESDTKEREDRHLFHNIGGQGSNLRSGVKRGKG